MNQFCLTALEAAEIAGLTAAEMTHLIDSVEGLALRVGDAWRIDPGVLFQKADNVPMALAA
ncbi:MAG: hypothetical protein HOL85_11335 [Rhodospirillaceae bacterium]|jgi:hypothetical protein|nr:hypothetical protein [Rhodospirillaceae bacterium]MBT6137969.1 hypothetical protein [Rhodospirillaceae bacterium]